jgi:hypothetical protein
MVRIFVIPGVIVGVPFTTGVLVAGQVGHTGVE